MIDDDGQRTTAALMAMNGMKVRAIAEAMNVTELRVMRWLTRQTDKDDPPPPKAA